MKRKQSKIWCSKKLLILILFSVVLASIISHRVLANGSHLYQVAHVNIIMKNGEQKNGYIPIYSGYFDRRTDYDSLAAKDFIEVFEDHVEKIVFAKNCYDFPGIGSMVATEEIDTFQLSNLQQVIFISWVPNFGGAFEITNIQQRNIEKLQMMSHKNIRVVDSGFLTDFVFVNLNPQISNTELDLIVKYTAYLNSDLYYSFPIGSSEMGDDSSYIKNVERIIEKESNIMNNEIDYLSQYDGSSEIKDVINFVKTEYKRRIKLNDAFISFIESGDKKEILECLKDEINDEKLRKDISAVLNDFCNKDSIATTVKEIAWLVNKFILSNYHSYFTSYESIINEKDVILIRFRWD